MPTTRAISNHYDIIDSRDVVSRIEDLGSVDVGELTDSERDELAALTRLAADGELAAYDWSDGVAIVRESHFVRYAQELADDCGLLKSSAEWPHCCIDWELAANELKHDYTPIEFDGVTYWTR